MWALYDGEFIWLYGNIIFMVSKSAWRRQRFFISPPPRKHTAYPTSQLVRQNWRQSSSSPTSGAPSPQTQKSTKRWITDWQRQTVPCLEQQALEESHKNQHLQSRGTAYPPVQLRDVGRIQSPPAIPRTFPPTVSPLHPQHPLERLRHKCWSVTASGDHQHKGHAAENAATLGWACLENGGSSLNQGARKDGRGNEPLPLRNVRCAEPPEDS